MMQMARNRWEREQFDKWINEPCPADEWLYRGQAAKYNSILPSLLRDSNKRFSGNRLRDLDPRTAFIFLQDSPVLKKYLYFGNGLKKEFDLDREGFYSYLNRSDNNKISFSRLIRALAQHYGFPTLFIDLTLDPWVALSFAVHSLSNDKFELLNDDAKVYRWPAKRISPTLLTIYAGRDQDLNPIEVIDISGVSTYFRRPNNQASVLALPVSQPEFNPDSFRLSGSAREFPLRISDLNIVDMLKIPNCESFCVPGNLLKRQVKDIIQMDSLFPDDIDLGYSYLTMIALLSLIVVFPEKEWEIDSGTRSRLNCQFQETIEAARVILSRECFRLVLNTDPSILRRENRSLLAAAQQIGYQTELARDAGKQAGASQFKKMIFKSRKVFTKKLIAEIKRESWPTFDILNRIPVDYEMVFDYKNKKIFALPIHEIDIETDWILEHINIRFSRVQRIIDLAEKIPAYAFEERDKYKAIFEVFNNDIDYEDRIVRCIKAQKSLRPGYPVFT